MPSFSLGTQNAEVLNLHFGQKRVGLSQHFGPRSWINRKPLQYTSLVTSLQTVRYLTSSDVQLAEIQPLSRSEDGSEEIKSSGLTSKQIPNFNEVEFLLTNLCDTTSIAELELKLDGFHLRVVRGLTENTKTLPPPILVIESINSSVEAPKPNGSVSTSSSLAISKPAPSSVSIQGFLDKAADGLVIIQSPKVGIFRRSRTIKGIRTPPRCKERTVARATTVGLMVYPANTQTVAILAQVDVGTKVKTHKLVIQSTRISPLRVVSDGVHSAT